MNTSIARLSGLFAAVALLAAGCSGSTNSSSNSTSTESSAAPAAATASASSMIGAPTKAAEPIPADLHCTDAIVWVNLTKQVYHMSGDPFYGRTKHGEYMCQGTADGKGYHLAGTPHHHTSMAPSPAAT